MVEIRTYMVEYSAFIYLRSQSRDSAQSFFFFLSGRKLVSCGFEREAMEARIYLEIVFLSVLFISDSPNLYKDGNITLS